MKLEIDLEDSIYAKIEELLSAGGLDTKSFIERYLTQIIIEMATHPEEYLEATEKCMETPIFKRIVKKVTNGDKSCSP